MRILLPYNFKFAGFICIAVALILTVIYFYYGPRISVPVLAIISSFIETKFFAVFKTNFFEEIIILTFIVGFSMVAFSKEKVEKHCLKIVRIIALKKAILIYIIWLFISVIFFFGNAYIATLVINIILPFIIYLIAFYQNKYKVLKKDRLRQLQKRLKESATSPKM